MLDERDLVAFERLQSDVGLPANLPAVHEKISRMAKQIPDQIAIKTRSGEWSYRQLMQSAIHLSNILSNHCVGSGDRVVLMCTRGAEQISSILGVLRSGAAYVPVDPSSSVQRIRQIVKDVEPAAIVVNNQTVVEVNLLNEEIPVILASMAFSSDDVGADNADLDVADDDLAYVMYTSGSTGRPKGVSITHRALAESTHARFEHYQFEPRRFLVVSPIWFDSSVAGIFWTLCAGGTLCIPDDADLCDIKGLGDFVCEAQVTETLCLPSLYELLLRFSSPNDLSTLQRIILAGESTTPSLLETHFNQLSSARLFNEYGPTEGSVWSSAWEFTSQKDGKAVPIGKAVPGIGIELRNRLGQLVPNGMVGEICLTGSRLASGYWNDPTETSRRFHFDKERKGERYYRTGDLGWVDDEGVLYFSGRLDGQLKINGTRVEPEEIESILSQCPWNQSVAVGLAPDGCSDEIDEIAHQLMQLPEEDRESILGEFVTEGVSQRNDRIFTDDANSIAGILGDIDVDIPAPRIRQRRWLVSQFQRETRENFEALHSIARSMVTGNAHPHLPRDLSDDKLSHQEIMEDWQTPMMKTMAEIVARGHGDVLEIGFGRGVSSTMIQELGVRRHTIVEMNPHCIANYFQPWIKKHRDASIELVEGRWQDVMDQLDTYDGVFFHAFPMSAQEFVEFVAESVTFAEHFFPSASSLLNPGGVFTYLSTEVDSLSRGHQRSLFKHFSEIRTRVQPLSVPQDTKDAWWVNQMVVVSAHKQA